MQAGSSLGMHSMCLCAEGAASGLLSPHNVRRGSSWRCISDGVLHLLDDLAVVLLKPSQVWGLFEDKAPGEERFLRPSSLPPRSRVAAQQHPITTLTMF